MSNYMKMLETEISGLKEMVEEMKAAQEVEESAERAQQIEETIEELKPRIARLEHILESEKEHKGNAVIAAAITGESV